jgi:predicted HNH restriction endonuclease
MGRNKGIDMGKKLPYTPNSKIKSALRQLFLRSRERAAVLKAHNYSCAKCGIKQSKAKGKEVKVEVHHKSNILLWSKIYEIIRAELLNQDDMEVLCEECHKEITEG